MILKKIKWVKGKEFNVSFNFKRNFLFVKYLTKFSCKLKPYFIGSGELASKSVNFKKEKKENFLNFLLTFFSILNSNQLKLFQTNITTNWIVLHSK